MRPNARVLLALWALLLPLLGLAQEKPLTKAQATTIFAPRGGFRIEGIGDSETERNSDRANNVFGDSWLTYLGYALQGRAEIVYNAGIGGNTSTQMLARFGTDVIAKSPNLVIIMAGRNDSSASVAKANIKAMALRAVAAGIEPLLMTTPPTGTLGLTTPGAPTATASTTGGTLAAGTYSYRVVAVMDSGGTTLAGTAGTATTTGSTGSVYLRWTAVPGAGSYRVYGRTSGSELLLATVSRQGPDNRPLPTWTDTGSASPSGALPSSNTTPVAYNPTDDAKTIGINNAVWELSRQYGWAMYDAFADAVDPATGVYPVGASFDGVHWDAWLCAKVAKGLATLISPRIPARSAHLATSAQDATNLASSSWLTQGMSGGLPVGWSVSNGTLGSATWSIVNDAAYPGGKAVLVNLDYTPRNFNLGGLVNSPVAGHLYEVSWRMETSGVEASAANVSAGYRVQYIPTYIQQTHTQTDVPAASVWVGRFRMPAGANFSYFELAVQGPCTIGIGQVTVRDLTLLGMDPIALALPGRTATEVASVASNNWSFAG